MPSKKNTPKNVAAKKAVPTTGAMVDAAIKHVTRRAGIKSIHYECYPMMKDLYSHVSYNILADAVVYMTYKRRKTLTLAMLNKALKTNGLSIVLTPDSRSKRRLSAAKKLLLPKKKAPSPSTSDTADEKDEQAN